MKVEHWKSGREEIRQIPVLCPACDAEVSVNGRVDDGKLVVDDCPACGQAFSLSVSIEDKEIFEEAPRLMQLGAEVTWTLEGGAISECTMKVGPVTDVTNLLGLVVNTGVQFYSHPNLTIARLYQSLTSLILEKILAPQLALPLIEEIKSRLTRTPPDVQTESEGKVITLDDILRDDTSEEEETEANDV